MSNRFKLLENFRYLNMSGQEVKGRKDSIVVMPRRSDVRKGLEENKIEPADAPSRAAHTMTTANISQGDEAPPEMFEDGDFVGFEHEGKQVNGEVKNVSARGILDVDIGTGDDITIVRVDPQEVDVENL